MLSCHVLSACSEMEKRKVLVVHSYEKTYAAYPDFNKMIAETFRKRGIDVELRTVYLDCEAYRDNLESLYLHSLLDEVSENWEPEIILVNDDQATYSLLKCGHPLAKQLPVVFGGVNYPNWPLIKQYPNVTGFRDKIDFMANIKAAKEIFGKGMHLFTIIDSTYLDKQIRKDAWEQLKDEKVEGFMNSKEFNSREWKEFVKDKSYTYFAGLTVRLQKDRSDAGLLWSLSQYTRDRCYLQLKRDFTTVNIGNICSSPSLTAINEGFGYGEKLLGGYMTTIPIQVGEMVDAAVRILHGEKPLDMPIANSAKEYVVDWEVMEQRGLSKADIPEKYSIIHIPFSEAYPWLWGGIIFSITVLLITLFVLLFFLYRREQGRKKKALNALEDEKETLALAIEGSDTYAWKLENDYFIFESDFWKSQGMMSKVLTFDKLIKFIHPECRDEVEENWRKISLIRKVAVQVRCDFNGKGYQWWEFRYKTIALPDGGYKAAGLLLNIQDIKDHEHELEEARLLAEKAELKQSFLANMSHEIRTPLNAIVGFSDLLKDLEAFSSEEVQQFVETININCTLLLALINDILDLSRIESGTMDFQLSSYNLTFIMQQVYDSQRLSMPQGVELRTDFPEGTGKDIVTDSVRLKQVVNNLINNARKFTAKGSITLGYSMEEPGYTTVFVEDTGAGISDEDQKHIFERFYKADSFTQGAGLGLSICQTIVERLHGTITVTSKLGRGTRFEVRLSDDVM